MTVAAGLYWALLVGILAFLLVVLLSIVLAQVGGCSIRCCHFCAHIATHGLGEFLTDPYEVGRVNDDAATPLVGP